MSKTKERLSQFADFKGFSQREFSKKFSTETYFNATKSIGSEKLERISEVFPELNMDWIITGRGEMIFLETQNIIKMKKWDKKIARENLRFVYSFIENKEKFKKDYGFKENEIDDYIKGKKEFALNDILHIGEKIQEYGFNMEDFGSEFFSEDKQDIKKIKKDISEINKKMEKGFEEIKNLIKPNDQKATGS